MRLAKLRAEQKRDPLIAIIVSVILCSVLMVYPLSYTVSGARPLFMLLLVLFWVMCQPTWCGIWFAFATGIFTDLLLDAPLGMNALSFVLITFIVRFLTRERRILTFGNLWVISFLAVLAHLFLTWILQIMGGLQFSIARHWQPLLTSLLVFPVMYFMLKKWRV
ncbi:rod shape-determining protein MreD [Acinetobacter sp. ANC 4169]|jgi:rod shape-determining protein MreD|uniref:rod shape-determining protein MreD n=1 Tax=Acinetobacter sp. ANC 4169 TaxID=1977879 RepID=UPI000A334EA4|nr:rod shape-determining protein MreD [Acinetobacter sp. ANC 4169]OTG69961.1 rod shape-determining protein MreD [Acinetobacter sp. ANC 4169]